MDILSYKLGQKSGGGSGTTDYSQLTNKPKVNNVELNGNKSLNDLGIQPAGNYLTIETDPIFSASASAGITSNDITNWNNKSNFSGSYNDLTNKPNIPDSTSDLTNDSGFITNTVNSLTNYYDKTTIDNKISSVYKYKGSKSNYGDLPVSGNVIGDVWNIENADATHNIDAGDNVAWTGSTWDKLAGTVDLSGYQTKIDSSHKLGADLVDDTNSTNKFVTASDITNWNSKYEKPLNGIPSTDLSSAVQSSLSKADSSIQDISGKQDIIQYSTMPTASADTIGKIIQYTGVTDNTYTNGFFYIGATDGEATPTYSWENIDVQENSGGGGDYDLVLTNSNSTTAETLSKLNELWIRYKNGETVKICFRDNYTGRITENLIMELPLYFKQNVNFDTWNLNSPSILDTLTRNGGYGYRIFALNIELKIVNGQITGYKYWRANPYYVGDSSATNKMLLTSTNTTSYTPTADYNPATKKYVDDKPTTYTGYDATKTQVLKNINGTLTWVDEA